MSRRALVTTLLLLSPGVAAAEKGTAVAWKRYDPQQARCPASSETVRSGLEVKDDTIHAGLLASEVAPQQPEAQLLRTDQELVASLRDPTLACPRGIAWKKVAVVELQVPPTPKLAIKGVRRTAKTLTITVGAWCEKDARARELASTEYLVVPRGPTRVVVTTSPAACKTTR